MKRIKVMLASIAVVAVVGGALAFKAGKMTQLQVYKLNAQGTACPFFGVYDPTIPGQPSIDIPSATVSSTEPLPNACRQTIKVKAQ